MPLKYKCPVCGCTEYYSLSGSASSNNDSPRDGQQNYSNKALINAFLDIYCAESLRIRSFDVSLNAQVCLCKNCGHIDLFNENLVSTFQSDKERFGEELRAKQAELENLNSEKKNTEEELAKIRERTQVIAKLLSSEDITIRQHKELESEAQGINSRRPQLEKRLAQLTKEIEQAQRDYNSIKGKLDRVTTNK